MVETNHLPHLISLIVSDSFFEELMPKEQEILRKAAAFAGEAARKASDERIADKKREIADSGTEIVALEQELREEMKKASEQVYEKIKEVVDGEIVKAYTEH